MNCDDVDIQEIEQAGINIYNKISEKITDLSIENAQYDLESIYTEAQKIGIDVGDMVEYGFEKGKGKCGANVCFNKQAFKDVDDMLTAANSFGKKLTDSTITAYRKAQCSPTFKKHVTPKVEWVW